MPVEILTMQESDLDKVVEIEKGSFKDPWKRKFFESDLNRPSAFCWVAKDGEDLLGYIINWRVDDALHIANIAVRSDFRRKGIATLLINEALKLARELNCIRIYLEVRPSNLAAINLYKKFGFNITDTRKAYYPDGEAGIVMERTVRTPS